MRAHIITAGKITNTIVIESLELIPGLDLIDADLHGGTIEDSWDGTKVVSAPPVIPTPEQVEAAALAELAVIDAKSIRAIREILLGKGGEAELAALDVEADTARAKIAESQQ